MALTPLPLSVIWMTTNLHDELYGVRGEKAEVMWKVAGRGKVK